MCAGPRVLRAATRVALLGLSQVTAVLLVAALLNDYGYFYGSWSELLGPGRTAGRPVRRCTARPPSGPVRRTRGRRAHRALGRVTASLPDPGMVLAGSSGPPGAGWSR